MYNDKIAYEPTLGDCLKELFGVSGGTVTSKTAKEDQSQDGASSDSSNAEKGKKDSGSGSGDLDSMSQEELAKAAQQAYDNAQNALKDGDWAKYGEYMDELEAYLDKLAE